MKRCEDNNISQEVVKSERVRQMDQWHATENVVQGHAFDGKYEDAQLSVYDFLMKNQHEIISFKMCD